MSQVSEKALFKAIIKLGLIQEIPVSFDFAKEKKQPIKYLSDRGSINEEQTMQRLAETLGLLLINDHSAAMAQLENYSDRIAYSTCWEHRIAPLYTDQGSVVVAFANPFTLEANKLIEFALGMRVIPAIASE
ncbi:MAG: hypothetical protein KDD62_06825, partial [Bdellovibrionales bacterium]|nr:hypothetical protein [Bdellovibrionales bacterium]